MIYTKILPKGIREKADSGKIFQTSAGELIATILYQERDNDHSVETISCVMEALGISIVDILKYRESQPILASQDIEDFKDRDLPAGTLVVIDLEGNLVRIMDNESIESKNTKKRESLEK